VFLFGLIGFIENIFCLLSIKISAFTDNNSEEETKAVSYLPQKGTNDIQPFLKLAFSRT
jgi:hypothetical protein